VTIVPLPTLGRREAAAAALAAKHRHQVSWAAIAKALDRSSMLAELIREEFGDGIMSAIDFELSLERHEHPEGDRVRLVLDGKFLPYRVF
jgi:cyanate lyase